jgi:hypothetical protein
VEFILYHELLHKHYGIQWLNGKCMVHTPEFKRSERKFSQFQEAETFLKKFRQDLPSTHAAKVSPTALPWSTRYKSNSETATNTDESASSPTACCCSRGRLK